MTQTRTHSAYMSLGHYVSLACFSSTLAALGIEGYGVLLNISNSACHILCGSDTARGFIDAGEANGNAVDNSVYVWYVHTIINGSFHARKTDNPLRSPRNLVCR